jgi:Domain of unknown function (DUF4249)
MKIIGKLITVFILFGVVSCIEPYTQTFKTSSKIIIVEGLISNETGLSPVLIKESLPSETGSSRLLPIRGATVFIVVNGTTKIQLKEETEGAYYFDKNFKAEIGNRYQLQFSTTDGNSYESNEELLPVGVPIKQVSHVLDETALVDAKGNKSPGYKLFVDIEDPANTANQYLWGWTLFERQNICKTCTGGYYYRTPAPLGSCVDDQLLRRYNNIFDYNCETNCWEIVKSTDLLVTTDELSDGKTLKSQFVGKMALYQYSPALLEIRQYSISKPAYDFINLSQQQGIQTGGLADTPPAQLTGNIKCTTDPSINTSGFFIVAGSSIARYWLDKEDAFALKIKPLGLFGGREPKLEPAGANTTRPPLAPCVNSLNRTNQKPEGWLN